MPAFASVAEPSPTLVARAGAVVQSKAIAIAVESCSTESWSPADERGDSQQKYANNCGVYSLL